MADLDPTEGSAPAGTDASGRRARAMSRLRRRPWVLLVLLTIPAAVLIALRLASVGAGSAAEPREVPLSEALASVKAHHVREAVIDTKALEVTLTVEPSGKLVAKYPAA